MIISSIKRDFIYSSPRKLAQRGFDTGVHKSLKQQPAFDDTNEVGRRFLGFRHIFNPGVSWPSTRKLSCFHNTT
jgi:hypothetical protein